MGTVNLGVPSQHGQVVIDADQPALREGARPQVLELCDSALRALSDFSALIGQSTPAQSTVERERDAHIRLEKALLRALFVLCGTLSDSRAKCIVFQQLRLAFPPEDKRLYDFAIHVLAEMSDLLERIHSPASSNKATNTTTCSCEEDSVDG